MSFLIAKCPWRIQVLVKITPLVGCRAGRLAPTGYSVNIHSGMSSATRGIRPGTMAFTATGYSYRNLCFLFQ